VNNLNLILSASLIVLLVLDLVTTATNAAFQNANLVKIFALREHYPRRVERAARIFSTQNRLEASLYLALMFLRFLILGIILFLFSTYSTGAFWTTLIVIIISALILYLAEWVLAEQIKKESEEWALRLYPWASTVKTLMTPLLFIPFSLFKVAEKDQESSVTESELIDLVETGQQEGVLEQEEHKMIVSIFHLGDTLAREIMVPRIDILAFEVNTPIDIAINTLIKSGHSRVPVYEETVDNILGLLYAKDLLRVWQEGGEDRRISDLLREVYFVPEAKKVDELLAELQAKHIHMAIVVDEYGGVAGLVTMEDIVEEIVGEIQDEYDQAEELLYQQINEDEYIFLGRIDLDDFNEIMHTQLDKSEADTLGGFFFNELGRVPLAGDQLEVDHLLLTVELVSGQRIRKVRAKSIKVVNEGGEPT
jgi:CBS domain containing-hemolysin-like protein